MNSFRIALRSLGRRKARMLLIGILVALGTIILVFGSTFSQSAKIFSKQSIVRNFTGDFILYSEKSREIPSPFAFLTPLPLIEREPDIEAWLSTQDQVEGFVAIAQNYGLVSVEKAGKKYDLPFIFYAVDPQRYRKMFDNFQMKSGNYLSEGTNGENSGIMLSVFQNQQYAKKYGVSLNAGDSVTLLSLTSGGSVNALGSRVKGIFEPKFYTNVFNYINFMDIGSYNRLYNFTGVKQLPGKVNDAFMASNDEDIFALADDKQLGQIDTKDLESATLSGYTMLAVRLKDGADPQAFASLVTSQGWPVKLSWWYQSSSFFATVADALQGVIVGITFIIFLVVAFILMNTQIISVLERTPEIGTYRAIGASKGFVRSMFLWETILLNGIAAIIGLAISLALILAFRNGVALPELMSQYLVGGGELRLVLGLLPFLVGIASVLLVSVLAVLYPIRVATRISPLSAMSGV